MNHRINLRIFRKDFAHERLVSQIPLIKLCLRSNGCLVPRYQAVNNDDVLALFDQTINCVGTDVAGTA